MHASVEAYQQAHRTFITFHDGKPLEPHIKNKSHDFNMKQQVETRRLFSRGHVNSSDPWYYFSSNFKFLPKTSLDNFFTSIPVLPDQRTRRTSEDVALREKYVALPEKKVIVFGPRMICPLNIQHPSKRAFKSFSKFYACGGARLRS